MINLPRSGYLPDVSGVFGSWRDSYKKAMASGDWDLASLSLHNMNGALDVEYRLPISTEIWIRNKEGYVVWKCKFCTTTETKVINQDQDDEYTKEIEVPTITKAEDVKTFEERCDFETQVLLHQISRRVWSCSKCKGVQPCLTVETKMFTHQRPHYRGCIYDEPIKPRNQMMQRRGSYPANMREWCVNYSKELEHQLAIYRLEYIKINGEDMADSEYKDDGK